ncbi:MAG: competence/damage-inducible protein A [Clostridiales bacterium]|nr:competence/damage-inducible protein A [Clostridiales bacterium]
MIAEILCIGTELLMGQVLNTNAQFLSRRLSALGVSQYHQTVVGDNPHRLEEAYRLALSRADVVITSGGLGPTVDDITKRIAAGIAGKELVLFPEAEEMVRTRFQQLHRELTPNNLSQAMFTPDSTLLLNPNGTAPGAIVPMGEGKVVIHLPGPPAELQPMFISQVEPWLSRQSGKVLVSRYISIFGMGEAEVDQRLSDLEQVFNPSLSPYCSLAEVQLRATACADTPEEAENLLAPLVEEVRRRLGDVVYAVSDDDGMTLAAAAVGALKEKGWTVATAESLTGGMISAAMVDISGASSVVRGGFVTYQTDTKTLLVDVPAKTIEDCNVVSAEVALAMAKGARSKLDTDIAVSATGLAGPDGGTPERPVGTVYVGIATRDNAFALHLPLSGNRARIRTVAMKHALNALRLTALGKEVPKVAGG